MNRTFVLVHGAWHGGWFWRPVAERLRADGHDVYAPTLTGLGERHHLLSTTTNLSIHIQDILGVLEYEDLDDVILVGHSYAGMVVTSVAASVPGRLRSVICIDGFVPERGECALDLLPAGPAAHYRESVEDRAGVPVIPPRPLERLGVTDPAAIRWLSSRLVPQPASTYSQPAHRGLSDVTSKGVYMQCTGWTGPFGQMADRAVAHGWASVDLPADHEVAATAPELLSGALLAATA